MITCDKCGVNKDVGVAVFNVEGKDLCDTCYEEFEKLRKEKDISVLDYLVGETSG